MSIIYIFFAVDHMLHECPHIVSIYFCIRIDILDSFSFDKYAATLFRPNEMYKTNLLT